ncbi:MAG: hypothetical protein M1814_002599 [Vezdaea aestivalis]|nr:MAG: hypothetical protein M1814_002599 [Vezdaea aestivalis]
MSQDFNTLSPRSHSLGRINARPSDDSQSRPNRDYPVYGKSVSERGWIMDNPHPVAPRHETQCAPSRREPMAPGMEPTQPLPFLDSRPSFFLNTEREGPWNPVQAVSRQEDSASSSSHCPRPGHPARTHDDKMTLAPLGSSLRQAPGSQTSSRPDSGYRTGSVTSQEPREAYPDMTGSTAFTGQPKWLSNVAEDVSHVGPQGSYQPSAPAAQSATASGNGTTFQCTFCPASSRNEAEYKSITQSDTADEIFRPNKAGLQAEVPNKTVAPQQLQKDALPSILGAATCDRQQRPVDHDNRFFATTLPSLLLTANHGESVVPSREANLPLSKSSVASAAARAEWPLQNSDIEKLANSMSEAMTKILGKDPTDDTKSKAVLEKFQACLSISSASHSPDDSSNTKGPDTPNDLSASDIRDRIKPFMFKLLKEGLEEKMLEKSSSEGEGGKAEGGSHVVQCTRCPKKVNRRKHMMRHTRPYGCTFLDCYKTFGSKNDWKRHENSQHFQLEMWRCQQPNDKGGQCPKHFYRREVFQRHLKDAHSITKEEELRNQLKERQIGRNCQRQVWCGFCMQVIQLKNSGLAAWEERYSHIEVHFKSGMSIDEYVPVDGIGPKGLGPIGLKDQEDGYLTGLALYASAAQDSSVDGFSPDFMTTGSTALEDDLEPSRPGNASSHPSRKRVYEEDSLTEPGSKRVKDNNEPNFLVKCVGSRQIKMSI